MTYCSPNRPFPSSPGPLFQNEGRCSAFDFEVIRDGPLEHWWGGEGGGEFSACTNYFFAYCLCRNFFLVYPSARIFFQTNIAFFWTVKSWFIIYVFVLYKLFYTHNRSKDTGHFNAKSFRKCTHSERGGSHLEWTASLCIFSVPALWNSSPTAHHDVL